MCGGLGPDGCGGTGNAYACGVEERRDSRPDASRINLRRRSAGAIAPFQTPSQVSKSGSSQVLVIGYLQGGPGRLERHCSGPSKRPSDSRRERAITKQRSHSGAQPGASRCGDSRQAPSADRPHGTIERNGAASLNEGRSTAEWPEDGQPGRSGGRAPVSYTHLTLPTTPYV